MHGLLFIAYLKSRVLEWYCLLIRLQQDKQWHDAHSFGERGNRDGHPELRGLWAVKGLAGSSPGKSILTGSGYRHLYLQLSLVLFSANMRFSEAEKQQLFLLSFLPFDMHIALLEDLLSSEIPLDRLLEFFTCKKKKKWFVGERGEVHGDHSPTLPFSLALGLACHAWKQPYLRYCYFSCI